MTRVLVCGGRDYGDLGSQRQFLARTMDKYHAARNFTLVIQGGARGADDMALEWATSRGVPSRTYMADWEGEGREAGLNRNRRMLAEGGPDLVIAYPGGRGTAHMVRIAREAGVEILDLRTEG